MAFLIEKICMRIEDMISVRLFGLKSGKALVLMNIGRIYSERIAEEKPECKRCGSTWYPRVCGHSSFDGKAKYCPYCGFNNG